ncbi:MAG: hypothetical protein GTN84_02890 [Hydrogenophaga sp.]|uniref:DUF6279 family lipoprotein n=1 Tax=Hydrogenophaga sp. TaxID=1904254 RepID=UPI00169545C5|nr:DUF6279 family lipoprotein [Hydrogenophaga sp.]NIM40391.1 hypothetical protein [Hydrogenophaga sp.]NIN25298.1 hypothetical protein [Hydrogenophaga sp.]NIN29865.1 hypothetical protein [Hydrogenophaga sp.]NIN54337.1 hypothetical protein [Hydrogenophaga sp.]NIO52876.1 hypothetical protein [Hydrogenophaga sp.]
MNTSFAYTERGQGGGAGTRRIIARALLVLALAALLAACTAARFAYNQAPQFSYWWLDSHFDFDDAQSEQVRGDIDAFFAWHRREELPAVADLLRQWQGMATRDLTADEACAQFEVVRARLNAAGERLIDPFARLAPGLSPAQLEQLQRRQARSNEEFERDFLRGTPEQRLQRRLDTAVSRSERFYGTLSAPQRELLRRWLSESPWEPQRTQAERQRRQADLLQTLRRVQAEPAQARVALRAHLERLQRSPTPGYQAQSEASVRHGCAQFAALHNSTTPAQRQYAVRELQGYQRDMETLSAQR